MKVIASAVLVLAIFGSIEAKPKKEQRDLADDIKQYITEIISQVPDPIALKDVDIIFPSSIFFSGGFNITEVSLSGLKALDIKELTYDSEKSVLQWKLNFNDIVSIVDTTLDVSGLFVNINNHFSVRTDFKDFSIEGYATLESDKKGLSDFNILVNLGESDFVVKGFLDNDKLSEDISKVLTQNVAKVFDAISAGVSPVASRIIKTVINIVWKIKG